ncbi:MAG: hypothetical protein QF512_19165, partial [Alphaproteobacteria bacterium]|nr:hypothetical protein [Alphaproteobacteria bacterium]
MIDIFGDRKSNKTNDWGDDWEDSPFTPDYLSQANNKFDAIRPGDRPEDYNDPVRRRRNKTRAPELFDFLDFQNPPLTKPGPIVGAAVEYGTNRRIVNDYNVADPLERRRMKGEAKNALAWDATASHEQRKAQMDSVAKAQKFDVTSNYYEHLKRYPYGPAQNHVYDEDERLRFQEDFDFFESTPEARQAIIDDLNAQIAPWPAYELMPEDFEIAATPNPWET